MKLPRTRIYSRMNNTLTIELVNRIVAANTGVTPINTTDISEGDYVGIHTTLTNAWMVVEQLITIRNDLSRITGKMVNITVADNWDKAGVRLFVGHSNRN